MRTSPAQLSRQYSLAASQSSPAPSHGTTDPLPGTELSELLVQLPELLVHPSSSPPPPWPPGRSGPSWPAHAVTSTITHRSRISILLGVGGIGAPPGNRLRGARC